MSAKIIEQIGESLREQSTQAVRRSNLIAARLGINPSDLEALEVLLRHGKATAGVVAAETGVSGGGVTKMIDRLEKAAFIRRSFDKSDRRKVFIEVNQDALQRKVFPLYASLAASMNTLLSSYSPGELRTINDFLQKALQISSDDLTMLASDM